MDQSTPKTENNYYETKIGDAIDEPAPVNPIPDRKHELSGDTIDIEEYIAMTDTPVNPSGYEEPETVSNTEIDEQNSDLERRDWFQQEPKLSSY